MPLDITMLILQTTTSTWLVVGFLLLLLFVLAVVIIKFASLWIFSYTNNAAIGLFEMIGMTLRRVPPKLIVESRVELLRAGIDHSSICQ